LHNFSSKIFHHNSQRWSKFINIGKHIRLTKLVKVIDNNLPHLIIFTAQSSHASVVLGIVILSVCLSIRPSVRLSVTGVLSDETKECTADILILHERVIILVFWHQHRLVGDVPFHRKFALKVTHPTLEYAEFDQCLLITSESYQLAKNVQLSWIGSRPCAFQRAIGEVRTLPLTTPKGGSKREFVVFLNKIQVQSNKVCYKVSLCENFQRQSCSRTIPLSNGV